jgi:hypothetical protein
LSERTPSIAALKSACRAHLADLRRFERAPPDVVESLRELRGKVRPVEHASGASSAMSWPQMADAG